MIDEKFIEKQRKIIEKNIKRFDDEIKENKSYLEIGSSNEDNALEFEAFEERQALVKSAKKDLKDLKAALKKIDEGKYGVCSVCGEKIDAGRLEAYSSATTCVIHAKNR